MTRYSIERVDPERARAELVRVWRDNLPVLGDVNAKFDWTYLDGPIRPDGVFVLSAAEDGDGGAVVGTAGCGVREFLVDGTVVRAGLLADLAVDQGHRTALPALRLVRQVRADVCERFAFGYGFPNRQAAHVFRRCGYTELGIMTRYVRVLRYAGYAQRVVDAAVPARAVGAAVDAAVAARSAGPLTDAMIRFRLEWPREVDDRFDALWERTWRHYRVVARRSAPFLRWRLLRHPHDESHIAALVERQSGELRAYAALGREGDTIAIRDFFGAPGDLRPLFERVAAWARRAGARSLTLRYLGDPRVARALRRAGFRPRPSDRQVVIHPGVESAGAGALTDASGWYLTDADEDT